MTAHELYYATLHAEEAWVDALKAEHGPTQYPGSRYDARAISTPRLAQLHDAWVALMGQFLSR